VMSFWFLFYMPRWRRRVRLQARNLQRWQLHPEWPQPQPVHLRETPAPAGLPPPRPPAARARRRRRGHLSAAAAPVSRNAMKLRIQCVL